MAAKRIALSNGRKLISDLTHIANRMPLAACSRDFDLSELNRLRLRTRPRIAWDIILMRAYGIISKRRPELRQMYVKFPWPHLYQHDKSVCLLTIARKYRDEERLFFARFDQPENHSLLQLQQKYEYFRREPIENIKQFRHQIAFANAPTLVRRIVWNSLFNFFPSKRASNIGTFAMSLSGYKGAIGSSRHLGPLTTILGVDPHPRRGQSKVLLTFDHRVIDGKPAVDILEELRQNLNFVKHEIKNLLIAGGLDVGEHKSEPRPSSRMRKAA